jgi:hypothetical protein
MQRHALVRCFRVTVRLAGVCSRVYSRVYCSGVAGCLGVLNSRLPEDLQGKRLHSRRRRTACIGLTRPEAFRRENRSKPIITSGFQFSAPSPRSMLSLGLLFDFHAPALELVSLWHPEQLDVYYERYIVFGMRFSLRRISTAKFS